MINVHIKRLLLIIVFSIFPILLILFFIQNLSRKLEFQNQSVDKTSLGSPVRLKIPLINVDASIEYVGITKEGEMGVPSNTLDVGWFDVGPPPGEQGSAVIAGHLDGKNGEPGVFTNLNKLKRGDKLYVEDNKGKTIGFIVRESRIYDPGYANEVFNATSGAHLNLVTCDGIWDYSQKNYTKRLVIFTDRIK